MKKVRTLLVTLKIVTTEKIPDLKQKTRWESALTKPDYGNEFHLRVVGITIKPERQTKGGKNGKDHQTEV